MIRIGKETLQSHVLDPQRIQANKSLKRMVLVGLMMKEAEIELMHAT
jgi:ribosomal 50S subunit-associated protein YjgA (DUF615 family)